MDSLISYREPESTTEMPKLTDYLHTAAAAEYLGVSQNTIRKWAARGDIPMHRNPANGYRLFKRSDLDKFLRRIERPVTASKPR
jgi:excisionase family DNA binding protein